MKFLITAAALLVTVPATAEVSIGTITIDGKEVSVDGTDADNSRYNQCSDQGCELYPMPRVIDGRIKPDTQPNYVPGKENLVRPRQ